MASQKPQEPRRSHHRGVVALIDAMLALFVVVTFTALVASTLQQKLASPPIELQRQGMSVLTALEYLDQFYSPIPVFAETSDALCMREEVYNGTSSALDATFVKSGCPASNPNEVVVWRTSAIGGQFKSVKLAIWLKTQ